MTKYVTQFDGETVWVAATWQHRDSVVQGVDGYRTVDELGRTPRKAMYEALVQRVGGSSAAIQRQADIKASLDAMLTAQQQRLDELNLDNVFHLSKGEHVGYNSRDRYGTNYPLCYRWFDGEDTVEEIEPADALEKLREFGVSRNTVLEFACDVANGYMAVWLYSGLYGIEEVFEADQEISTWSPRDVLGNCDSPEEFVHRTYFVTQSLEDTVDAATAAGVDTRSLVLGLANFPVSTKQLADAIRNRE